MKTRPLFSIPTFQTRSSAFEEKPNLSHKRRKLSRPFTAALLKFWKSRKPKRPVSQCARWSCARGVFMVAKNTDDYDRFFSLGLSVARPVSATRRPNFFFLVYLGYIFSSLVRRLKVIFESFGGTISTSWPPNKILRQRDIFSACFFCPFGGMFFSLSLRGMAFVDRASRDRIQGLKVSILDNGTRLLMDASDRVINRVRCE